MSGSAGSTYGGHTAVGYLALSSSYGCEPNTAVGYKALQNNTTGYNNAAFGFDCLRINTTGNRNTAVAGYGALLANTTGYLNTAVGHEALYYNTEGHNNTAVGYASFYQATTGDNNIAIGSNAGRYTSDGSTSNVLVHNSIYLGVNAKSSADNQTNQIIIGYDAIGKGSNTVVLGDDNITDVWLSEDAGATVHCAQVREGSALKIKKNISEIESPLEKITKLRGIEFDYKETDEHSIGMIAEEVNEIFPELVTKNKDGEVEAMSYSRMTAVLLEAVKELSQEVKELKTNNIYNNKERD